MPGEEGGMMVILLWLYGTNLDDDKLGGMALACLFLCRMEIVFPRGVALGVEAPNLDKGGDIVDQADRELGRLIVEMLLPLEDTTVVVFREERQAQKAQV